MKRMTQTGAGILIGGIFFCASMAITPAATILRRTCGICRPALKATALSILCARGAHLFSLVALSGWAYVE